ncbi:MAG: hypothetical protein K1X89_25640 [Myxococcaceae bacterium]|nr:hypothetical protein [Myxococcaceae bacterium]
MTRPLALALLLSGCATTQSGGSTGAAPAVTRAAKDYYPLAVGNRWRYDVKILGATQALDVALTKTDQGAFVDSMGNRLQADAYGVRDERRYLLREPIAAGTSWTNVVSVSSVERYQILSVGETCEVAAGRFEDCVAVESRNRESESRELVARFTFARGIGLIRVATELRDGQKQIPQSNLELVAYGLQGPGGSRFGGSLPPPDVGATPTAPR